MSVDAVRAGLAAVAREHERAADEWRQRAKTAEAAFLQAVAEGQRRADLYTTRLDQLERIIRAIWRDDSQTGDLSDADYDELGEILGEVSDDR